MVVVTLVVLYDLIGMLDVLDIGLLGHTHLVGKGGVRYPAGGLARCGLLEHAVDLLEGKALRLGDEEVGVHEAAGAQTTPDIENLSAKITLIFVDHIRSYDGDNAIP